MRAKPNGAKFRNLITRGGIIYYQRRVGMRCGGCGRRGKWTERRSPYRARRQTPSYTISGSAFLGVLRIPSPLSSFVRGERRDAKTALEEHDTRYGAGEEARAWQVPIPEAPTHPARE